MPHQQALRSIRENLPRLLLVIVYSYIVIKIKFYKIINNTMQVQYNGGQYTQEGVHWLGLRVMKT